MLVISKLYRYKIFLLCLIGLTSVSCKTYYKSLTIETPIPAKEELPADIQSLTLMNRSINNEFQNFNKDSLQLYFYRNGYQVSKPVLDITTADTTIMALASLMFESGRYDVVVPVDRNLKRDVQNDSLPNTLNSLEVSSICKQYNTDALMVMERFSTKVMTDYSKEKYIDRYAGNINSYYATLDLKYDAFFRIYKPDGKIWEIQLSDTIYWENAADNQNSLFENLPAIKQALISAGIKVALDIDSKISPSWVTTKRGYFLLEPKNDPAQQLMNENKTDEAEALWMEKTQSTNKKIRSRAEYNMALASELDGDVDKAIEWGLKSFYTLYNHRTEIYLQKLKALKDNKLTK